MNRHPARTIPYRDLVEGLREAKDKRLVSEQIGEDGLLLYCYTESCVYDRQWSDITLIARGLILDTYRETVAATPFPKFFNIGEGSTTVPDLSFETFEKLDGSLIILWHHNGRWRAATKGSFRSSQAQWAAAKIARADLSALTIGTTYLAEAIYPENRIVVHYDDEALVMLAAYEEDGSEIGYDALQETAAHLGWRCAKRHSFNAVSDLVIHAKGLPPSEEGFVLRFSDGLRLKVKGDEYRRIHALVSRLTPLAMWEALEAGDDMEAIRKQLPEEFWEDFDAITKVLGCQVARLAEAVQRAAAPLADLSDKEVGLQLAEFPEDVRTFIFPWRKQRGDLMSGRSRRALFRCLRPTGNRLDGYTPSYAINRVMEESK